MPWITHFFSAATLLLATSAAQAGCWTSDAVAAAKVINYDTMLMVSSLRCRNTNVDVMRFYNDFVDSNRPALKSAGLELERHFSSSAQYDHYVTRLANSYGSGVSGMTCDDVTTLADQARSQNMTLEGLARLADQNRINPSFDEALCEEY